MRALARPVCPSGTIGIHLKIRGCHATVGYAEKRPNNRDQYKTIKRICVNLHLVKREAPQTHKHTALLSMGEFCLLARLLLVLPLCIPSRPICTHHPHQLLSSYSEFGCVCFCVFVWSALALVFERRSNEPAELRLRCRCARTRIEKWGQREHVRRLWCVFVVSFAIPITFNAFPFHRAHIKMYSVYTKTSLE